MAYNLLTGKQAQLCPGGACRIKRLEPIQRVKWWQVILVVAFLGLLWAIPEYNLWNIQDNVEVDESNFDTIDLDTLEY